MNLNVYGIRHHGPGSAKSLIKALREQSPDLILIEAPQDAEKALVHTQNKELVPPVSLLMYDPSDLGKASFYPCAVFSPEWQAIQYAHKNKAEIGFIDLPAYITFSLRDQENSNDQLSLIPQQTKKEPSEIAEDPLGYLAKIAGFEDRERWWEYTFEKVENTQAVFPLIIELMEGLREESQGSESKETLLREAFMRKMIRKWIKEGFQNIAIVCGAWHAPVLQNHGNYTTKADNALLKGFKKKKTASTWVPWTYELLARSSGYGAGVQSPAWYELLFSKRKDIAIRWMVKAAQVFRKNNEDISPSHAIEAANLANTLAIIRGQAIPGLNELRQATLSVFCHGREEKLQQVDAKIIVGDASGKVPKNIPALPLQKDIEKQIKSFRLSKLYQTAETADKTLDLRKENHLASSHFFRRMSIINVPWATLKKGSSRRLGAFSEIWWLKWKPVFSLRIIEANALGNTLPEAATRTVVKAAIQTESLAELTEIIDDALNANLPEAFQVLTARLEELSALTEDILILLKSVPPLIEAVRYGSTRQLNVSSLEKVIFHILPRVFTSLPLACTQIDDQTAEEFYRHILSINHYTGILKNEDFYHQLGTCLTRISDNYQCAPLLRGLSVRLLFDREIIDEEKAGKYLSYAVSDVTENAEQAAFWLEGFLRDSGLLLVYAPALWSLINEWIDALSMESFQACLPILRRTFSSFSDLERKRILEISKRGVKTPVIKEEQGQLNMDNVEELLPSLLKWIG